MRNLKDLQDELDRHNTYGGEISEENFYYQTMSDVVQQIINDWDFDKRVCKVQCEVRDKKYEMKKLSKEVLENES